MPARLAVDREQVRMLVLDHGPREAARMCGIAEGTVLDWSASGHWLADTRPKPALLPPPASQISPIVPIAPAKAKSDRLARERDATTTAMSAIALRTATAARHVPLAVETPSDLLALAKAHAAIHRLDSGDGQSVRINVYADLRGAASEPPVIDI